MTSSENMNMAVKVDNLIRNDPQYKLSQTSSQPSMTFSHSVPEPVQVGYTGIPEYPQKSAIDISVRGCASTVDILVTNVQYTPIKPRLPAKK